MERPARVTTRLEDRYAESPSDPDLLLALAEVHEKLGDPEAALDHAERALEYRRGSFELVSRVGDLRSKLLKKQVARADKQGRTEEASELERQLLAHEVEDYRRRVEIRPGDAPLRLTLARRLMRGPFRQELQGSGDHGRARRSQARGHPDRHRQDDPQGPRGPARVAGRIHDRRCDRDPLPA